MQHYEVMELIAQMSGIPQETIEELDNNNELYDKVDELLDYKYGITFDNFTQLLADILPMTYPQQAAISKSYNHVMGTFDAKGFLATVSVPCKLKFK